MSGKIDIVTGRLKEAAGVLAGDEKLRAEGKAEQAVGKIKETVEKVVDTVRQGAEKAIDKVKPATKSP